MKQNILIPLTSFGLLLISCQSAKMKNEAELKAKSFFTYLKEGDENKLASGTASQLNVNRLMSEAN